MSKEKSVSTSSGQNSIVRTLLFILLIVLIVALVANFFYLGTKTSQDRTYIQQANNLRVYSQSIAANASTALSGDPESFSGLRANYSKLTADWDSLQKNVPPQPAKDIVASKWDTLQTNVSLLLSNQQQLTTVHEAVTKLRTPIEKLREISQNTLNILQQEQSDIRLINQMQQEELLLGTIQHDVNSLLSDLSVIDNTSQALVKETAELASIINMLQQNGVLPDKAQQVLLTAKPLINELDINVKKIAGVSSGLINLHEIDDKIFNASKELLDASTKLTENIESLTSEFTISSALNYILVVLIALTIVGMVLVTERNTRKRLQETATENTVNQEAILQLLDEIGDLADGDLTVSATVSEAFTGAIADSINYSIEQLRELVQTINKTSEQVSNAAETSQALAMNLAEAAEHQAGEIAGVSTAISEMAYSIDQVSATALESENVAKRSVEIAHNGSKIVHSTIAGMDTIREQIQDTSKRIKRLGESSQEIGDIVGLIDDIAEQTNILALNAAIQASMAGDAGRGFAVVADEVQRLAERSSAATKQIETLVKAIQTDTNEAVISMEQTTSEVVRGAKLAENAGVALEEIENVSQALAKLIQTISSTARQQASTASHISRTMDVIQEITSQTSSGSTETAVTIGRLTTMSRDMQKSVSGFKLPNN